MPAVPGLSKDGAVAAEAPFGTRLSGSGESAALSESEVSKMDDDGPSLRGELPLLSSLWLLESSRVVACDCMVASRDGGTVCEAGCMSCFELRGISWQSSWKLLITVPFVGHIQAF